MAAHSDKLWAVGTADRKVVLKGIGMETLKVYLMVFLMAERKDILKVLHLAGLGN